MQPYKIIHLFGSFPCLLSFFLIIDTCVHSNSAYGAIPRNQSSQARGSIENVLDKILPDTPAKTDKDPSFTAPITLGHTLQRVANSSRYKLPSWFNYDQFKLFFGKRYSDPEENEIHKRIYLRTALKVFEQRALYRTNRTDILPSINELSDMRSSELLALRRKSPRRTDQIRYTDESACCTFDQVHRRIVELLDKTSGEEETDLALSRAYVDELQQKPISGSESEQSINLAGETSEPERKSLDLEANFATDSGPYHGSESNLSRVEGTLKRESSQTSTKGPAISVVKPKINFARPDSTSRPNYRHTSPPTKSTEQPVVSVRQSKDNPAGGDTSATDFERSIEESVRQQIERQLSPNTSQGKQLTDRLSSFFGQPVKLTASIARPSTASTKSPSFLL